MGSLRRGRALAALGRREKAGQLVGQGGDAGGDVAIATAGGKVMVDDARVVSADVMATNGVIHVIDKVLMP